MVAGGVTAGRFAAAAVPVSAMAAPSAAAATASMRRRITTCSFRGCALRRRACGAPPPEFIRRREDPPVLRPGRSYDVGVLSRRRPRPRRQRPPQACRELPLPHVALGAQELDATADPERPQLAREASCLRRRD